MNSWLSSWIPDRIPAGTTSSFTLLLMTGLAAVLLGVAAAFAVLLGGAAFLGDFLGEITDEVVRESLVFGRSDLGTGGGGNMAFTGDNDDFSFKAAAETTVPSLLLNFELALRRLLPTDIRRLRWVLTGDGLIIYWLSGV